ncbi:tagaturonate epimerase family protein, partial [bacterium]|nr:tagaturonate epimerase family protein [bacterium]
RCPLTHENASSIRSRFDFTRPKLIGLEDSIGLGDRLGIANPAHLRAIIGTAIRPVLAQQSIRELERTQRRPEEVMDAATWAVFQEGYRDGFGADADHLKTPDDIDVMAKAGFTMFTFDPSEYVVNEADSYTKADLESHVKTLPWQELEDEVVAFIERYENRRFRVVDDFELQPSREQVLRGLMKYGGVIAHTKKLFNYFKGTYPELPAEFELSVDETASVTTPFEHYLVVNELKRLGVKLVSLAPRFVGDFEKGIDYRGDLDRFKDEYLKHVKISEALGPYKISIHSGSDKFSVYKAIGQLGEGQVHVKTAGTSYLEALRTVAAVEPPLFGEILDFARVHYEVEKATYHVSGRLENVPASEDLSDDALPELFEQDDARQVLHVTFGKVLTTRSDDGAWRFRDRIMRCLRRNERKHYEFLIQHFTRHLAPFGL